MTGFTPIFPPPRGFAGSGGPVWGPSPHVEVIIRPAETRAEFVASVLRRAALGWLAARALGGLLG